MTIDISSTDAAAAALTVEGARFTSAEPRLHYLGAGPPAPGGVLEIAPGIHWLRMPLPIDLNHINLWLIEDGTGYTLVDTGFPAESCTAVWETLETTVLRERPLQRILLTHYHPDHMGCAAWLQQRHSVPVRIAARALPAAQFIVDGPSPERREASVRYFIAHGMAGAREYLTMLAELNRRSPLRMMPQVTEPLVEGELLAVGDWRFSVIETDGHALAHQSLYSAEPALLISGDQILPTISPNISVSVADWGLDPLGDYLASLDRMEQLPAGTVVLPSHGRPFTGLHERIADLRAHHEQDLALLLGQLGEPRSAYELMPALYGRQLKGFNIYLGLHECIAHLEHLVRRGAATRTTSAAGAHRYRRL
jgi:glyoxylase-like metal-dependent hydrolase (beta-lactamase superfamily II)